MKSNLSNKYEIALMDNKRLCKENEKLEKQLNCYKELIKTLEERKDFLERKLADKKKPHFYEVSPRVLLDIESRLCELEVILQWINSQYK